MPIKYTDFEPSHLTFTDFADQDKIKVKGNLRMAFHRYGPNEDQLQLQLPWQKIFKGGVPNIDDYHENDKARSYLKLPFDISESEARILYDKLVEFDKLMSSDAFKTKYFGKKAKKYEYIPVMKNIEEDNPDKPPMMKLKLWTNYQDDSVKTQVLNSELVAGSKTKRKRTEVTVETVQDFKDNVDYGSNVRLMIQPTKLWAQSENLKDPNYGVTWRILAAEVEPKKLSSSLTDFAGNGAFIDSDASDDEVEPEKVEVNAAGDDDSDEESDESDEESEDDSPPSPVLKKKGKSKSKNN